MSQQNFTQRGDDNLIAFRDALTAIANLPADLLTGVAGNAGSVGSTGAGDGVGSTDTDTGTSAGGSNGNDNGNGGAPEIHVLVISDSPAHVIVSEMASKGVAISIKRPWTDGVSNLSRAVVTRIAPHPSTSTSTGNTGARDHGMNLHIDFLAGGNPIVATHCLATPDLLLSKGGNFVDFAQLFALGAPRTMHFKIDHALADTMAGLPGMLAESSWYAEQNKDIEIN